jgi:hypothetical protein
VSATKQSVGFKQNFELEKFTKNYQASASTMQMQSLTVTLLLRESLNFYPNISHFLNDLGQIQKEDLRVADQQV